MLYLLPRVFAISVMALGSIGVAKAGSTIAPQAVVTDPPPTTEAPTYPINPLSIEPLDADQHDSEVVLPQVPNLPEGITYEQVEPPTSPSSKTLPPPEPIKSVVIEAPREWTGSIPEVYGEGSGCTPEEASIIARAMWDRGASDDSVQFMLRVVSRESLCSPDAHNGNRSTGDDSWGLCQQNNLSGWFNEGKLLEDYDRFAFAGDFKMNAEACALMWSECGKGPWNYGNYYCSTPKELR
jgi:hypothetical protein